MLKAMSPTHGCTWFFVLGLLGACTLERAPRASSESTRGSADDGTAAMGGGTGGQASAGDGDGAAPGDTGDWFGGPCSDDDPLTACATGAGTTGNDPSCFDSDPQSVCPDLGVGVGGGDGDQGGGDGDGDSTVNNGQCARVCDDGFYCNGAERCDTANPTADPDGCVTTGVCGSQEACIEASQSCAPCADGDDPDGDGHADIRCGGGDCREGDPFVFPGATEVCNLIDDDCDGIVDGEDARAGCSQNQIVLLMRHVLTSVCMAGACQVEVCVPGWFDCNQDPNDGCEHDINPVPADCFVTDCLGAMVVDDNDVDNGDPCMQVTCTNGQRSVAPAQGASCGNNGTCDQQGSCQEQ